MKNLIYFLLAALLFSCSSTRMVDSWKSDDYANYKPRKVLVVGITENLTARKIFEEQLKNELIARNTQAVESYDVFEFSFMNDKQTKEDIDKEVEKLSNNGFDAVLISTVKGVDEKTSYSGDTFVRDYYWRRFGRYYYLYQDVYFVEGYYSKYNVYHIEATLYDLKEDSDKSLVWVASYNMVDPYSIETSVNDYVEAIIKALEKEKFINSIH